MTEIYYKSDFKLRETDGDFSKPFRFRYFTSGNYTPYIACFDGKTYTNCKVSEEGGLDVYFVKQKMGVGRLVVEKSFLKTNPDGTCQWVKREIATRNVMLTQNPITIKAEVVDEGVMFDNINVDVIQTDKGKAVRLSGDFDVDVDSEGIQFY